MIRVKLYKGEFRPLHEVKRPTERGNHCSKALARAAFRAEWLLWHTIDQLGRPRVLALRTLDSLGMGDGLHVLAGRRFPGREAYRQNVKTPNLNQSGLIRLIRTGIIHHPFQTERAKCKTDCFTVSKVRN